MVMPGWIQLLTQLQASEDSERGLDKPPVLRHYEAGVRSYRKNRRAVDHTGHPPAAPLVEGMPRIPQELMLAKKRRLPGHVPDSKLLSVKTASARRQDADQMVQEAEVLEEPGVMRGGGRGGGGGGRVEVLGQELKRLQRKARNTLDDWLEFYRAATGIRCPDADRTPDAPQRSRRSRRQVCSAALPPALLHPPGSGRVVEDVQSGPPPADPPRHLSAPVDYPLSSASAREGPRTPRKPLKEESQHVTQIGALRVHSNVRLE
ncbi:hypothetical protein CRUP_016682 [Coryphaenoides rupestris]|nr:hypothetical protein CRUP_016682 [Coryphaenoides rupestris]